MCGYIFFISLGLCLGVGVLDHMITLCLIFWGTARPTVPKYMYPHSHQQCVRVPSFFTSLSTFVIICSFYCLAFLRNLWILSHIYLCLTVTCFLHLIMVILVWLAASYSLLICSTYKPSFVYCWYWWIPDRAWWLILDTTTLPLKKIEILITV